MKHNFCGQDCAGCSTCPVKQESERIAAFVIQRWPHLKFSIGADLIMARIESFLRSLPDADQ